MDLKEMRKSRAGSDPKYASSLDERESSDESLAIHVAEAQFQENDDYGVAAALDRKMDTSSGEERFDENEETSYSSTVFDSISAKHNNFQAIQAEAAGRGSRSPSLASRDKYKGSTYQKADDFKIHKMVRFSLYETATRYYLVGGDVSDSHFRMLKIDRTAPPGHLSIVDDELVYSKRETNQILNTIEDGNRLSGGMKLKANAWGLLGFISFTDTYYMLIVTKKQAVAMIGGQYIYQIDGTELVPLSSSPASRYQSGRNADEARFLGIFNNLDLSRSFYFSYFYNVTKSLQNNVIQSRQRPDFHDFSGKGSDLSDMFVWNHHLLEPAEEHLKNPYDWCLPIIHGYVDQSTIKVFGRNVYVTLIARRSRFFAGARFLKRGANDLGYVANDVETEQIVADVLTTSFDNLDHHAVKNPSYTSFVQHRGSIPLYWTQDNSGVSPKPAIDLTIVDPFYASAALHFDNLFERYGAPITVLNLVKARERLPRESKLLIEYQNAIKYLNECLPEGKKIQYKAYDMARAAKTRGQDVIATLEDIAEELVKRTGFFHNGSEELNGFSAQNGVTRSNCIDCLDRTNAAQFVLGKRALAYQLQALGVIAADALNYDCDATNLFAHMFNEHGDSLATQYGGSHLVNTTDSYRKINNWQSHSRDMLESFRRYYHNSFFDNQRQEAYNLFLGNYIYAQGQPMLWELPNDYYLHHLNPITWSDSHRRDYIHWFTPEFLQRRVIPPRLTDPQALKVSDEDESIYDSAWWLEYYRPSHITSFSRSFVSRMNTTERYFPRNLPSRFDWSPFSVRKHPHEPEPLEKKYSTKDDGSDSEKRTLGASAMSPPRNPSARISSLQSWLHPAAKKDAEENSTTDKFKKSSKGHIKNQNSTSSKTSISADKSMKTQWTLRQFYDNALNPTFTDAEAKEYNRYMSHPQRLPLVVPSDLPALDNTTLEYLEYVESANGSKPTLRDTEIEAFDRWTGPREDPLIVTEGDWTNKRYQAYGKWLKGKSFFKQSKVDPESAVGE